MTFVLPDEDTPLSDLLGTPEKVGTLLTGGERIHADVDLMLPKFAFSDRFELADVLCALGLTDAFTPGADFSGMTDVPAHLERVIQETVIDLNEKGVEAAAYTAIIPKAAAAPYENETLPRIDFHLTRPFLFVVQTAWDDTPLFIGTVSAPGESR
jgi:serpin B